MPSFNKVVLMGNLTRDPQVKNLPGSGGANAPTLVADFGLAVNRRYKTSGGEEREETAFVDCAAFGRQAEVIAELCRKGKPLLIEGRLKYDTWEDKTGGGKRSKLSVVVESFQFVGSRESDGASSASGGEGRDHERSDWKRPAGESDAKRPARRQPAGAGAKFKQSDIPF
jgi:single-strand DNA-binding protein